MDHAQVFAYNTGGSVVPPVPEDTTPRPFKTVIEVGVNQGQDTVNFLTQQNMIVYGFEPVWSLVEMLNKKFKDDPRVQIIPCAVDEVARFTQFNVAAWRDQGCSSLYDYADDLEKTWSQTPYYQLPAHKQKVQVVRLDDFIRMYKIERIDYLWVDAQGSDFAVLRGLGEYVNIVQEGRLEAVLNVNLYKHDGNHVNDVVPWLQSHGFETTVVPDANPQQCEANVHFKRKG